MRPYVRQHRKRIPKKGRRLLEQAAVVRGVGDWPPCVHSASLTGVKSRLVVHAVVDPFLLPKILRGATLQSSAFALRSDGSVLRDCDIPILVGGDASRFPVVAGVESIHFPRRQLVVRLHRYQLRRPERGVAHCKDDPIPLGPVQISPAHRLKRVPNSAQPSVFRRGLHRPE